MLLELSQELRDRIYDYALECLIIHVRNLSERQDVYKGPRLRRMLTTIEEDEGRVAAAIRNSKQYIHFPYKRLRIGYYSHQLNTLINLDEVTSLLCVC